MSVTRNASTALNRRRLLAGAAVHGLRLGLGLGLGLDAAGEHRREHQYREGSTEHAHSPEDVCYPLMRSMAAPQAESLSSSRSKPRSRW